MSQADPDILGPPNPTGPDAQQEGVPVSLLAAWNQLVRAVTHDAGQRIREAELTRRNIARRR